MPHLDSLKSRTSQLSATGALLAQAGAGLAGTGVSGTAIGMTNPAQAELNDSIRRLVERFDEEARRWHGIVPGADRPSVGQIQTSKKDDGPVTVWDAGVLVAGKLHGHLVPIFSVPIGNKFGERVSLKQRGAEPHVWTYACVEHFDKPPHGSAWALSDGSNTDPSEGQVVVFEPAKREGALAKMYRALPPGELGAYHPVQPHDDSYASLPPSADLPLLDDDVLPPAYSPGFSSAQSASAGGEVPPSLASSVKSFLAWQNAGIELRGTRPDLEDVPMGMSYLRVKDIHGREDRVLGVVVELKGLWRPVQLAGRGTERYAFTLPGGDFDPRNKRLPALMCPVEAEGSMSRHFRSTKFDGGPQSRSGTLTCPLCELRRPPLPRRRPGSP